MSSSSSVEKLENNISFSSVGWIQAFGPLSAHNILEYFYLSPFYETDSNNEELRVQGATRLDYLDDKTGVQFVYERNEKEPLLFIVKKIWRSSRSQFEVLDVFYCIYGTFYKSPELFELFKSREDKIFFHSAEYFSILMDKMQYTAYGASVVLEDAIASKDEGTVPLELVDFPSMKSVLDDVHRFVHEP